MSIENAWQAFRHSKTQQGDVDVQLDVIFDGLAELLEGIENEMRALRARIEQLERQVGSR